MGPNQVHKLVRTALTRAAPEQSGVRAFLRHEPGEDGLGIPEPALSEENLSGAKFFAILLLRFQLEELRLSATDPRTGLVSVQPVERGAR